MELKIYTISKFQLICMLKDKILWRCNERRHTQWCLPANQLAKVTEKNIK